MENCNEGAWIHSSYEFIKSSIKNFEFSSGQNIEDYLKLILIKLNEHEGFKFSFNQDIEKKCPKLSEYFRVKGSDYFTSMLDTSLDNALEEYAKSVAYAPSESLELSLAYADRSAILFNARLITDCILDIDRALKNIYCPDNLKAELYCRKAMCLRVTNPDEQFIIENYFAEARKWIEKMDKENQEKMDIMLDEQKNAKMYDKSIFFKWNPDKFIPKLNSENIMIPGLSDAIELRFSDKFGRHMVASRNIKPGEILVMQKPYTKVINTKMRYKFCWYCAEQTWACIPCENCVSVVYCSEICREKAKLEFHDYECQVIWALIALDIDDGLFVSLRLTIKALKEAKGSLETLKNNLKVIDFSEDPLTRGFTNDILDPTKFASVYGLISHSEEMIPSECPFLADSIILTYLLATKTNFFGKKLSQGLKDLQDHEILIFIIGFIVGNMRLSNYNSFSVEGNTRIQKFRIIVPSFSFFNHSCHQMIIRRLHGDYMISRALYSIKKGEQIFDNYGVYYDELRKEERQEELFNLYRFSCDCEPCKYDWPMYPVELDMAFKSFSDFKKMSLELYEIYNRYLTMKKIVDNFGKKYSIIPNMSKDVDSLVIIVEKFCKRFKKNSTDIVNAVLLLDGLLTLTENRYLSLN